MDVAFKLIILWTVLSYCSALSLGEGGMYNASLYIKGGKITYKTGILDKSAAAFASFKDELQINGWGTLDIMSGFGDKITSNAMFYASGYLEGALTSQHIWAHYNNMQDFFYAGKDPKARDLVKSFFKKQDAWTRTMIQQNPDDRFWKQISFIVSQFDGLVDGYRTTAQPEWDTDVFVLQMLNGVGDLIDLIKALLPSARPDFNAMTHQEFRLFIQQHGHCSALVKVLGAFENIFVSHSSWFVYQATDRIYKHYQFNVDEADTAANKFSFSSYPGFLESLDDFYLMNSNLVLLQTTNNVFNASLYDLVVPQTLFAWQRVRVANAMAHSGAEWYQFFRMYNSGTYNNQYMVIDLNRVHLNKEILDEALWVVEQIPGLVEGADQTNILRAGYWPSYNVPFYESVYNKSGYPDVVAQRGTDYSYQLAPRAKIFRRDQDTVVDMDTMKSIMRYNDYKEDPYSAGNSCDSICCRGDLEVKGGGAFGCYDTKVSDYKMAMNRVSYAINGPTRSHNLDPFSWSGPFANLTHMALPDIYAFDWITARPLFA